MIPSRSLLKRCALFVLLLLFVSACGRDAPAPPAGNSSGDLACPGCDVIFLNIDLFRADFVGLLSGDTTITPNIDRFFRNALVFEDVMSTAGETYRANYSIQTGMGSHAFNISGITINRMGKLPTVQGPARNFVAELLEKDRPVDSIRKNLEKFTPMAEILSRNGWHTFLINEGWRSGGRVFLDRGFGFVKEWNDRRRPRLITESLATVLGLMHRLPYPSYVLYRPNSLHPDAYSYPAARERIEWPGKIEYSIKDDGTIASARTKKQLDTETRREAERLIYAQQVRYVDDELARLFEVLDDERFRTRSIIVLYANHGTCVGDHGIHERHGVAYQCCIHVPLLIRHPNLNKQMRVKQTVSLLDLGATIYDMVGVKIPMNINSMSLLPMLRGGKYEREYFFGRNDQDEFVRYGRWKLVKRPRIELELYDLHDDPNETRNLALQKPDIVGQLSARLAAHRLEFARYND